MNLKYNSPKETMVLSNVNNNLNFKWKVDLIYIPQNFPFALQSRVNPHANLEMLRLPLQSEITGGIR